MSQVPRSILPGPRTNGHVGRIRVVNLARVTTDKAFPEGNEQSPPVGGAGAQIINRGKGAGQDRGDASHCFRGTATDQELLSLQRSAWALGYATESKSGVSDSACGIEVEQKRARNDTDIQFSAVGDFDEVGLSGAARWGGKRRQLDFADNLPGDESGLAVAREEVGQWDRPFTLSGGKKERCV